MTGLPSPAPPPPRPFPRAGAAAPPPPPPPVPARDHADAFAAGRDDDGLDGVGRGAMGGAEWPGSRRMEQSERITLGGACAGGVGVLMFRVSGMHAGDFLDFRSAACWAFTFGSWDAWLVLLALAALANTALNPAGLRDLLGRVGLGAAGANRTAAALAIIAFLTVVLGRLVGAPGSANEFAHHAAFLVEFPVMGVSWYLAAGGCAAAVFGTLRRVRLGGP